MGHVVDEIVFDFSQPFLPEDGPDGEDEDEQEQEGEENRGRHEPHGGEQVAPHLREVDVEESGLCGRVFGEEQLSEDLIVACFHEVGAAIDDAVVGGGDVEMIVNGNSVASELLSEVAVKLSKINSLGKRFVASLIEDGRDDVVQLVLFGNSLTQCVCQSLFGGVGVVKTVEKVVFGERGKGGVCGSVFMSSCGAGSAVRFGHEAFFNAFSHLAHLQNPSGLIETACHGFVELFSAHGNHFLKIFCLEEEQCGKGEANQSGDDPNRGLFHEHKIKPPAKGGGSSLFEF